MSVSATPGGRLGGKTLLLEGPVLLAADYGGSLYLSNGTLDAGVLASVPVEGIEVYGALRGFGTVFWFAGNPNVSAALTLGVEIAAVGAEAAGTEGAFVELTLATGGYNGLGPTEGVQPVGFSLVPAFGVRF